MPSYIGSSLEFTKNNLIQIVGVKEANIEVVEVSTAPEGTAEETVVSQSPKPGEGVDLNTNSYQNFYLQTENNNNDNKSFTRESISWRDITTD